MDITLTPTARLRALGLALCAGLIPALAFAGGPPVDETKSLGAFLSNAIPTSPMHPGLWQVKVSPGYLSDKDSSDSSASGKIDMHGYGGAASVLYSFSDNWGAAFLAAGNTMKGTSPVFPNKGVPADKKAAVDALVGTHGGAVGDATASGVVVAVSGVWDYWSGDEFRLPVFLGMSYLDATEKSDSTDYSRKNESYNRTPGVFIGITPQFNVWHLRIAPYFTNTFGFTSAHTKLSKYVPANPATVEYDITGNGDAQQTHTMGLSVEYRPWDLGLNVVLPMDGISTYTLTWSRKFGNK